MALWTEEQRSRRLSARKVLADAIEERGKVKRAAAGSSAWQQVAALECGVLRSDRPPPRAIHGRRRPVRRSPERRT
ncbi:MAG: hypothetical protein AVDCRST_MAG62-75 [uncultured Sphingomonas sp.]|uniref:Uncharacterized protein n=1 Tax=uncultured Sphingomonas sp. TaxID=158754 RepID=A0A6J4SR41_9SPHN|nr:MAG: hypothetical protein AVDCRST_MAG62-75 [uncultured Sphingomonas sp.]